MAPPKDLRKKFGRFRILVVGRANAGKTTLLQRVCNTTEKPEIFNGRGKKIDATVVQSSLGRGYHKIENELVFGSNPNFVFHDSCGFEAGGEAEFKQMKKFVLERASTTKLKERIHAIWYCIPMDEYHRAITKAEEMFFAECNTSSVPVIAVFTKFDALWDAAFGQLKESGLTWMESKRVAPERAKEIFTNMKIWDRLRETQYPPKDCVYLAEMDKDNADCGPLLEGTTSALGEEAMQMLLISTQRTNLTLCIKYAVEKSLMPYIGTAGIVRGSSRLSEDIWGEMQKKIGNWFPHVKGSGLSDSFLSGFWLGLSGLNLLDLGSGWFGLIDPNLLPNYGTISTTHVSAPRPKSPTTGELHKTQTLQLGIATILILEYSFFLFEQHTHKPAKIIELTVAEYERSGTQAAVQKAVEDVLSQDHADDKALCNMIIDIILQNRMSKVVKE